MLLVALLGLSWFCCPLGALVLDFNNIKSSADVQGSRKSSQCLSDKDCNARKFCLQPRDEKPFCATCRGSRRRCQRHAMCCPGTLCVNDVCTAVEDAAPILERQADGQDGTDTKGTHEHPLQEKQPQQKPDTKKSQGSKGQEGESCLRTFDCGPGLCCARHFWTKICKPVLLEGQVCSRRGHKDTAQAPEIFQRCDCGPGLSCRSQATGGRQYARLRVCQKI
ncbi:dickkopf-related protein 4 [Tupaia chinensis]|uniref:Dickkopf-related protein 4 n=1 Tax=Tupaia chinensis TaxID=246437 RepID=L9LCE3_TUPCH|nr:dickkopf-related protein 4 [Tupaia chinensis]ELW71412.1 Dickkopf-related protein 4 [Tupaia chinensis]